MKSNRIRPWGISVLTLAAAAAMGGSGLDLSWHTIDGGGVLRSTNGALELSGTIGQFDAGKMSGGGFALSGGFWFELAPGDCTEDGSINLPDQAHYTSCANGPDASPLADDCLCMDLDGDGDVDIADFAELQIGFNAN